MREVSFGKRLLSMLLALVLILGMAPVTDISGWFPKANAADGTSSGTKLPVDAAILFSDLHTNKSDYKQDEVEAIMSAFKNTGMPYTSVTSCGDAFSVNEENSYSNGPYNGYSDTLVGYIKGSGGLGDSSVDVNFVWSDHDRYVYNNSTEMVKLDKKSHLAYGAGNDGTYGTADDDNYYVYALSMGDLCSYDRYKAGFNYTTSSNNRVANGFTATVEEAIANFKADAAKLDKSKPLLIASHQPLFDNRNDNAWAEAWFDAINEVAAEMDVVFFYGHNHKYDSGSDYYYGKGSVMPVATADGWNYNYETGVGYKPTVNLTAENKTLNFTHLCAGYLEPTSTGSTSGTSRLGTAISVVVYNDSLLIQTYDAKGLYTGSYAVNETVKRDHAKVETTPEPETPTSVTLKDEETGLIVSAPALETMGVKVVSKPAAVEELLVGDVVAYDITVTGFTNGTASVTINIPQGVNPAKFVVFHVPENGDPVKMPGKASEDGKTYTFTTTHFSIYVGGEKADNAPVGTPAEGTGNLAGTTTYTYTQVTSITAGGKYVIVGNGNAVALMDNNGSFGKQNVTISGTTGSQTMTSTTALTEWTFSGTGSATVFNGTRYLRYNSGMGMSTSSNSVYVVDNGNNFAIKRRERNEGYALYYNGSNWTTSGSSTAQYVRLFKLTKTESADGVGVTFKLHNTTLMYNEDTQDLTYEITLSDGTVVNRCEITWKSGGSRYVNVTDGVLTATNYATEEVGTTVTATLTSVNGIPLTGKGITLSVPVTVKPYKAELILNPPSADLLRNQTVELTPTITYNGVETAVHGTIAWTSSNPNVATVDNNGKVTAVTVGTTTITATVTTVEGKSVTVHDSTLISVAEKEAQQISVTPMTITVQRDALTSAEVATIIVDYGDEDNDGVHTVMEVPMTLGMLQGNYNLSENGIYEGLTVTFAGKTCEGITLKVVDKSGNNYPEYPDPGSVSVDKHANATYLQSHGIVNVELSTSGLPYAKGVDVIVMLDMSSSMDRCVTCGKYTGKYSSKSKECSCSSNTANITTRVDELKVALQALEDALKTSSNAENIKIAITDFNGMYKTGPCAYSSSDQTADASGLTSGATTHFFTGGALDASAFIPASELDVSEFPFNDPCAYTGTNYDYAFDAVYRLGHSIQKQNAEQGLEDRELFVLFMSDGAPNQFNYYITQGGNSGSTAWNYWLTGTPDQYDGGLEAMMQNDGHLYFYDSEDRDGDGFVNEHRMANAIKGDPNKKYPVIRKSTEGLTDLLPTTSSDYMYELPGLGATMYSLAFYVTNDGPITEDSAKHALRQVATQDENDAYYVDASNGAKLAAAFDAIGSEIAYAATGAYYVDQLGDSFNLQLGATVNKRNEDGEIVPETLPITPEIKILNYNIYKPTDLGKTIDGVTVTAEMIGKRYGDAVVVEKITFSADGTKAYSTLDSTGPDGETITAGQNILINGVIYAKSFYYNNNLSAVSVRGTVVDPESFRWNIGTVNNIEWALNYWIYLAGSMEGNTSSGSYKTNNYAILYYKNWLGNNAFQATTSPQVGWESANVSYAFYLVNDQGIPVVNQTTGQTGNFVNAVKVTSPVVFEEIMLNNLDDIDTIEAKSNTILPAGYDLYDEDATYKVVILSEDGKGSWTINIGKTNAEGKGTTYVTGYAGNNVTNEPKVSSASIDGYVHQDGYDYTHTTVWFAVVWIPKALPDAVVVDYGLPVDISVLVNDQFGANGFLNGVGQTSDKEAALKNAERTNIYTDKHSEAFVDKITTAYGTAETFGDKVRYTPKTMDWGTGAVAFDKFAYEVKYEEWDYDADYNKVGKEPKSLQYYYGDVMVIPATTVYYEDTFMSYGGTAEWKEITGSNATQDEDRPGKYSMSQIDKNNVYGYDSHYTAMSEYSMGNVHHVTVDKDTYATASFSFHGTGFDVISLTSNKTGTLAIMVRAAEDIYVDDVLKFAAGQKAKAVMVDTYYGYTKDDEGNWVTTTTDPNPLYQVPVMKIEDLPYGQYNVVITATYGEAYDHTEESGYELYLDAVRIYDPAGDGEDMVIDEDGTVRDMTIADIYAQDGEGWPIFEEIRNQLIDEEAFKGSDGKTNNGVVFIDSNSKNTSVTDYRNLGPNNELYLAPGQSVAFQLDLSKYIVDMVDANGNKILDQKTGQPLKKSIVADVQLGVKSADGTEAEVTLTADNVSASRKFATSTDMYYSFSQLVDLGINTAYQKTSKAIEEQEDGTFKDADGRVVDEEGYLLDELGNKIPVDAANDSRTVVAITNTSGENGGVVSITNIKVTFKEQPAVIGTDAQILLWNRNIGEAAIMMIKALASSNKDAASEGTTPEDTTPEGTTPEGTTPEDTTPEDTTPEDTTPEGTTPEGTTPEDNTPEDNTPENNDPEDTDDVSPETGCWLSAFLGTIGRFFRTIFGWLFN